MAPWAMSCKRMALVTQAGLHLVEAVELQLHHSLPFSSTTLGRSAALLHLSGTRPLLYRHSLRRWRLETTSRAALHFRTVALTFWKSSPQQRRLPTLATRYF